MKHRKCWSKSIGERGARVRLYEDRPGGPLNRSVYVKGREVRKSLGHRDQELAITQAYELLHSQRTSTGRRLLRENPLTGIRLPKEKNPERPVMSHDVYLKLLGVAPRVHPLLPLALIVAEGTGRRISAWRNLVWDDVDFEAKTIHWRAEHDKKGYEQVVVMSDVVREALAGQQKAQAAIGKARSEEHTSELQS